MNKFIVGLAIVAACAAVASANLHHRYGKHGKHGLYGHQHGNQLLEDEYELDQEERDFDRFNGHEERDFDRFTGQHNRLGNHLRGVPHRHAGLDRLERPEIGGHFRVSKGDFIGGRRHGGLHHNGSGHRNQIVALRGKQGGFGNVESRNHLEADRFAEAHEGSLVGGSAKFGAGHNRNDRNDSHDVEGRNKQKNMITIKGSVRGTDEESEFKNLDGHSDSAHFGASKSAHAAHEAGGKLGGSLDVECDLCATGAQGSSLLEELTSKRKANITI